MSSLLFRKLKFYLRQYTSTLNEVFEIIHISIFPRLYVLATGQIIHNRRKYLINLNILQLGQIPARPAHQVVRAENRLICAEFPESGRKAPAGAGVVYDIVVD